MPPKFLITFVFICFAMQLFSQGTIIGKWRRVNPNLKYQDTTDKNLKFGDLEIRADSTFHIEGDTTAINSAIPGWHSGDEENGTWELSAENQLVI